MSTNSSSPVRPAAFLTMPVRILIGAWLIVVIGAYVLYSADQKRTSAIHDELTETQKNLAELKSEAASSRPELLGELTQAREQSLVLQERIDRMESVLERDTEIVEQASITESERAVRKASVLALAAQAGAAQRDLGKIKQMQAEWAALEASLLESDSGKRIVGSAKHFQQVVEIWQSVRPDAAKIVQWESQLNALNDPIDQAASEQSSISITAEHQKMLTDFALELHNQATDFEQQKLFLESVQRETAALPPAPMTLVEALNEHRAEWMRMEAETFAEARGKARAEAEQEWVARLAAAEKSLADTKARQEEMRIESEAQQVAEEGRVAELQRQATRDGLNGAASQVEDEIKWARLEREMNRDMGEIRGLLTAYTSPGLAYRSDGTKGPISLSFIQAEGGLDSSKTGLGKLLYIAVLNNDRPSGGLPVTIVARDGTVGFGTNLAPVERAQELLVKYGELMVRKQMLAE